MNCRYCNTYIDINLCGTCSFCKHNFTECTIGPKKIKRYVDENDAVQPIEVLRKYHTYDLIVCLKIMRKKKSDSYSSLVQANHDTDSTKHLIKEKKELYRFWKKRTWIIENLLIEIQGYFPERITDKYLNELYSQCFKSSQKRSRELLSRCVSL
ncbi:hypothetical protein AB3H50_28545 [Bacillus pacificus]|nr:MULTISPECIES: hypothetical protein [Bacillus cereus group]EJP81516.1 hypothetical protein IC1_06299 [Bacillus cereus VD022]EOQ58002.1 hypothetical protein IAY_06660 [Bacillus cereus TIAC219]MEB8651905.1 hypothetical protein [Bacillus cereus]MEB8669906.1 hypothetical protein [Bacillus cereus]